MKKRILSVLSVLLCCSLFFLSPSLGVNAYAVDYNGNTLPSVAFDVSQVNSSTPDNIVDYSDTATVNYYDAFEGMRDIVVIKNTNNNFYTAGKVKTTILSQSFSVKKDHNYTVKFKIGLNANVSFDYNCYVYVYDGNGNATNTIILYEEHCSNENKTYYFRRGFTEFDFNLSGQNLPAGYSLKFGITVNSNKYSDYPYAFILSKDISYIDNDDNSGLLNKIISAISVVWQSIKDGFDSMTNGFSNMISSMSNWFTNLGNTISTKFSNMTTSLSNWFAEQARKIQDFNTSVGNWFADLGNRISGFFVKLYNDIIDALKRLFIPSDGFFDIYLERTKSWASTHFGFLYTAADLMISMVNNLKKLLSSDNFNFVLPQAEFTLNNVKYILWHDYVFPMTDYLQIPFLKYMYGLYKGMLSCIFAFAIYKYMVTVYDKIISN